eukprot:gnl/Carplike_NY0171/3297_a4439_448.p1 GENE.gnl/Carplike_NY0171/3297_a4439_448~~gnl/Carplike_NY0171/3297_a4439_448.p1  ORF type:complete len:388 (+),score=88.47 gnl/Carplike_NY0171/3297_a4439_448:95-1258(+)
MFLNKVRIAVRDVRQRVCPDKLQRSGRKKKLSNDDLQRIQKAITPYIEINPEDGSAKLTTSTITELFKKSSPSLPKHVNSKNFGTVVKKILLKAGKSASKKKRMLGDAEYTSAHHSDARRNISGRKSSSSSSIRPPSTFLQPDMPAPSRFYKMNERRYFSGHPDSERDSAPFFELSQLGMSDFTESSMFGTHTETSHNIFTDDLSQRSYEYVPMSGGYTTSSLPLPPNPAGSMGMSPRSVPSLDMFSPPMMSPSSPYSGIPPVPVAPDSIGGSGPTHSIFSSDVPSPFVPDSMLPPYPMKEEEVDITQSMPIPTMPSAGYHQGPSVMDGQYPEMYTYGGGYNPQPVFSHKQNLKDEEDEMGIMIHHEGSFSGSGNVAESLSIPFPPP